MQVISRSRPRGFLALATVVALCLLLVTAAPAQARPAPGDAGISNQPGRTAVAAPGLSELATKPTLKPDANRAKARAAKGGGMTLAPPKGGRAPTMVTNQDPDDFIPTCSPFISTRITPSGAGTVIVEYLGEVYCNFYLSGYIQSRLIDRSNDNFGAILQYGNAYSFGYDYYAYSYGAVVVDGRLYEHARDLEVALDVQLQTVDGTIWGECGELTPPNRYLVRCVGIGSTSLFASVASGTFASGLPPYNPAVTIRDDPGITLATTHSSGSIHPGSTARQNIVDVAIGLPARTSDYSTVGETFVPLDGRMLRGVVHLRLVYGYRLEISEFAGGLHSPNSRHYRGKAVDIDAINGVDANAANPNVPAVRAACAALGATEILGPGDPGHNGHVHCAWPL